MAEQSENPTPKSGASAEDAGAHASAESAGDAAAMAGEALDAAQKAAENLAADTDGGGAGSDAPLELPSFHPSTEDDGQEPLGLPMLHDVNLNVKVELGRTRMYVEDVLRLNPDSVIELDKAAGDPVDVYVNDRHVARGEVLVVNDNFCVRISEIIDDLELADA